MRDGIRSLRALWIAKLHGDFCIRRELRRRKHFHFEVLGVAPMSISDFGCSQRQNRLREHRHELGSGNGKIDTGSKDAADDDPDDFAIFIDHRAAGIARISRSIQLNSFQFASLSPQRADPADIYTDRGIRIAFGSERFAKGITKDNGPVEFDQIGTASEGQRLRLYFFVGFQQGQILILRNRRDAGLHDLLFRLAGIQHHLHGGSICDAFNDVPIRDKKTTGVD